MDCGCQNCTNMQDSYIPYAHGIMNDIELAGVPTRCKARRILGLVSAIDRRTLKTPILTRVFLRENTANEERSEAIICDAKWALRAAMTPHSSYI